MMKTSVLNVIVLGLSMFVSTHLSFGKTYSTLSDGTWDNNESVWSLDGENPCYCTPGREVEENIVIRHKIKTSYDLSVMKGGSLVIDKTAELHGLYSMLIEHGTVKILGVMAIAKYSQDKNSRLYMENGSMNLLQSLDLSGFLQLQKSSIHLDVGRVNLSESSKIELCDVSLIEVDFGEIYHGASYIEAELIKQEFNSNTTNRNKTSFKSSKLQCK